MNWGISTPLDGACSHPLPCAHTVIYSTLKQFSSDSASFPSATLFSLISFPWNSEIKLIYIWYHFSPSVHSSKASLLPTHEGNLTLHNASNTSSVLILSILQGRSWSSKRALCVFNNTTQARASLCCPQPASILILIHDKTLFIGKDLEDNCHEVES